MTLHAKNLLDRARPLLDGASFQELSSMLHGQQASVQEPMLLSDGTEAAHHSLSMDPCTVAQQLLQGRVPPNVLQELLPQPQQQQRRRSSRSCSELCLNCGALLQAWRHERVCGVCAQVSDHLLPEGYRPHAYKRINHLNEIIAQLQGKQNTSIPPAVHKALREEFAKHRVPLEEVTEAVLKHHLKRLELRQYYEHTNFLLKELNAKEVPVLKPHVESMLRSMFLSIQQPFEQCRRRCCPGRKNFLNYRYTIRKLLELLGEMDMALRLEPLKNKDKLYLQEQLWMCICNSMGWKYHPTY